ncbi:MAG TPA: hypothetical protein VNV43_13490 [Candidatus Acidoferrales bacterium]|nr:hypothetical protein [Candidatus Acidoferrales bacterium]
MVSTARMASGAANAVRAAFSGATSVTVPQCWIPPAIGGNGAARRPYQYYQKRI